MLCIVAEIMATVFALGSALGIICLIVLGLREDWKATLVAIAVFLFVLFGGLSIDYLDNCPPQQIEQCESEG